MFVSLGIFDRCGDGKMVQYMRKRVLPLYCVSRKQCNTCWQYFCNKCEQINDCDTVGCENQLRACCFEKKTCNSCSLTRCGVVFYLTFVITVTSGGGECDGCGSEFCSFACRHHIQERCKEMDESLCLSCALEGASLH